MNLRAGKGGQEVCPRRGLKQANPPCFVTNRCRANMQRWMWVLLVSVALAVVAAPKGPQLCELPRSWPPVPLLNGKAFSFHSHLYTLSSPSPSPASHTPVNCTTRSCSWIYPLLSVSTLVWETCIWMTDSLPHPLAFLCSLLPVLSQQTV